MFLPLLYIHGNMKYLTINYKKKIFNKNLLAKLKLYEFPELICFFRHDKDSIN